MKEYRDSHNADERKLFFIDTIAKFCDKCGSPYSVNDLDIIQDTNISSIIHFSCRKCKSDHIATFVKPLGVSNRMPINCDLSIDEIAQFASMPETSPEEILEIYTYLKNKSKITI